MAWNQFVLYRGWRYCMACRRCLQRDSFNNPLPRLRIFYKIKLAKCKINLTFCLGWRTKVILINSKVNYYRCDRMRLASLTLMFRSLAKSIIVKDCRAFFFLLTYSFTFSSAFIVASPIKSLFKLGSP
jgi:hypothetical protein